MINFKLDNTKVQTQLTEKYFELHPSAQKIIQLFSVIYAPIDKNSFISCLSKTDILDENNKPWGTKTLSLIIDKLIKAGLLVQENRSGVECHPLLTEIATRHAVETEQFETLVIAVEIKLPIHTHWKHECRIFYNLRQCIREIRIGFYRQDVSFINKQIEDYRNYSDSEEPIVIENIFEQICNNPFDETWLNTLPTELYRISISSILFNSVLKLSNSEDAFMLLEEKCYESGKHGSDYLHLVLTEQLLLRGDTEDAQDSLGRISEEYKNNAAIVWGWLSFLRGENEQAIKYYTDALKILKKAMGKRQIYFHTIGGLFFILALLKDGSAERLKEAEEYATLMSRQSNHWLTFVYARLKMVLQVQQGDITQKELIVSAYIASVEEENSLQTLFCSLCLYWMDVEIAKKRLPNILEPLYRRAIASGHHWLAMEAAELLSRLKPSSNYKQQAAALREDSSIQTIVDLIQPQAAWEMCLNALANLQKQPQTPGKPESEMRLAWFITFYPSRCVLQPKEQKVNAKGEWSKGRPIAIKRLSNNLSEFNYVTSQDMRVCSCIEAYNDGGYYGKVEYNFSEKAILALIGHPAVFWEDTPNIRVEIVKGEPELLVKKEKQGRLTLEFSPKLPESQNILHIKETPTRIKVIEIKAEHRRIAEIIGKDNKLNV
ncbi:ATP-dependent helicase, partial [Anabaena sp. UHCC 0204]|nr:ATP-dependent helicase [Anabaena sp. UHCC 0204]